MCVCVCVCVEGGINKGKEVERQNVGFLCFNFVVVVFFFPEVFTVVGSRS